MTEQRKDILDMLAEGKITAEEAEQLIAALERDQPTAASSLDARPKGKVKYLRVLVDAVDNGEPSRVNVRVPLQLLRAGVRLTALIPPQALGKATDEMNKSGVPFDLTQLKPEQLEALVEHLDEMTVEVDSPDAKVRVFCE
ncbi:SHOCT-like domain-containing protein [Micromonospora vulcania]|uniref:YvlB/LiaX N-terminal domain-containing protein n=1 Tax=Micromonospora vulcania TaxID=1441873 RepID=A0ABW1H775_9ACTN